MRVRAVWRAMTQRPGRVRVRSTVSLNGDSWLRSCVRAIVRQEQLFQ